MPITNTVCIRTPSQTAANPSSFACLSALTRGARLAPSRLITAGLAFTGGMGAYLAWPPPTFAPFPQTPSSPVLQSYCQNVHDLGTWRPSGFAPHGVGVSQSRWEREQALQEAFDAQSSFAFTVSTKDVVDLGKKTLQLGFQILPLVYTYGDTTHGALTASIAGPQAFFLAETWLYTVADLVGKMRSNDDTAWRNLGQSWCRDAAMIRHFCSLPLDRQQMTGQFCATINAATTSPGKNFLDYGATGRATPTRASSRTLVEIQSNLVMATTNATRDISFNYDERGQAIDPHQASLNRLVESYPPAMHAPLRRLVTRIRLNSQARVRRPSIAYLHGAPGTGKTRFVEALSEILDVPLRRVVLNGQNCNPERLLLGQLNLGLQAWASDDASDADKMGALAFAMHNSGVANPIIFVDEFSDALSSHGVAESQTARAMTSFFKLLLGASSSRHRLFGPDGLVVDWSGVTIILAGNQPLLDAALASRVPTLEFTSMNADLKHTIALRYVDDRGAEYYNVPRSVHARVNALLSEHLHTIVASDDRRGNPGVRILLRVVDDFCDALLTQLHSPRADMALTTHALDALIEQLFDQYIV